MNFINYFIALVVLFIFYLIGRKYIMTINSNITIIYVKYYSFAFIIASIVVILVHYLYVLEGFSNGMPTLSLHNDDSIKYIKAAEDIIKYKNLSDGAVRYFNLIGAYSYIISLAILFSLFGKNILIVKFFNVLLYSLSVVLFGRFVSFHFGIKKVKQAMIIFILFFPFLGYTALPLKEELLYFLSLLILIKITELGHIKSNKNIIILFILLVLLFFTRMYVGIIFSLTAIVVLSVKKSFKSMLLTFVILLIFIYIIYDLNIGVFNLKNFINNVNFSFGTEQNKIFVTGIDNALNIVRTSSFNYIKMIYLQIIYTFFSPIITSYPRMNEYVTMGAYLISFINYLGSFVIYILLPSTLYGFYHIIIKRKDLVIIYLPVILFFLFFLFNRSLLRYQLVTKIFWLFISIYGLQFYNKWKYLIPIWLITIVVIIIITF